MTTILIILSAALAVSEALALIPGLKSNSNFTFIVNALKWLYKLFTGNAKTTK